MRFTFLPLCGFVLLLAAAAGAEQIFSVDSAAWLAGCWSSDNGKRQITEVWMHPAGKAMLGMSRTVVDGAMREYEFVQIAQQENGEIHYIAKPSGQDQASFKLIEQSATHMKFENATHDFPQRIIYRLQEDKSLLARIEGNSKGVEKGFDYPMRRAKCSGE